MKKLINLILILCLILGMQSTVYAASTLDDVPVDVNKNSDIKTVLELMESEETLEFINAVLEAEKISFVQEDIEWSFPQKVYCDTDIMGLQTTDKAQIKNCLELGNYIYVASAYVNEYELEVFFSRGLEVSEDLKYKVSEKVYQEALSNVGKWHASSVGVMYEPAISYQDFIRETDVSAYDETVIVMSQKGFRYPILIGFDKEKAQSIIPIYNVECYSALENMSSGNTGLVYCFADVLNVVSELSSDIKDNDMLSISLFDECVETPGDVLIAAEVGYSVLSGLTRYQQEYDQWCWAACAQMCGKYMTGSYKTQSNIVQYVKGNTNNTGANNSEFRRAVQYAVGNNYSVTVELTIPYATFSNMISVKKHPVAIGVDWTNGDAHGYVVDGVSGNTTQKIRLIDPWGSNTTRRWYAHADLISGTSLDSGYGRYEVSYVIY